MLLKISKDRGDSDSCIRFATEEYLRFYGLETNEPVTISRINGKPLLQGLHFFVSFSHTKGLKACVISEKAVGVDVEKMTCGRDFAALSLRFFADGERTKNRYKFYELWTAKEALKKLTDAPLTEALKSCDYAKVRHFDFIGGFALSVAGEGNFFIVLFFD